MRFITRRFIGEYDPNLEKIYAFQTVIDNEMIYFEILDSAGDPRVSAKNKYVRMYFSGSIGVTATLYTHRMDSLTRNEND